MRHVHIIVVVIHSGKREITWVSLSLFSRCNRPSCLERWMNDESTQMEAMCSTSFSWSLTDLVLHHLPMKMVLVDLHRAYIYTYRVVDTGSNIIYSTTPTKKEPSRFSDRFSWGDTAPQSAVVLGGLCTFYYCIEWLCALLYHHHTTCNNTTTSTYSSP